LKAFVQSISTLQPQILTIIITTIIIVVFSLIYNHKIKKLSPSDVPDMFVIIINKFIKFIEELIIDTMGPKFKWLSPYFLYLSIYLGIGNLLCVTGLESVASNYTVVFSCGLVTFISIYIVGLKFQKLAFFKRYLHNPFDLLNQFAPLISLTFRLFGNATAGATLLAIIYSAASSLEIKTGWDFANYYINSDMHTNYPDSDFFALNLLGSIITPPFHFYFDIFDGLIQTYVFVLLSLSYIGTEAEVPHKKKRKRTKNINMEPANSQYIDENIDIVREA